MRTFAISEWICGTDIDMPGAAGARVGIWNGTRRAIPQVDEFQFKMVPGKFHFQFNPRVLQTD